MRVHPNSCEKSSAIYSSRPGGCWECEERSESEDWQADCGPPPAAASPATGPRGGQSVSSVSPSYQANCHFWTSGIWTVSRHPSLPSLISLPSFPILPTHYHSSISSSLHSALAPHIKNTEPFKFLSKYWFSLKALKSSSVWLTNTSPQLKFIIIHYHSYSSLKMILYGVLVCHNVIIYLNVALFYAFSFNITQNLYT